MVKNAMSMLCFIFDGPKELVRPRTKSRLSQCLSRDYCLHGFCYQHLSFSLLPLGQTCANSQLAMLKHRPCCFHVGGARQAECVMKLLQQLNVSKFSVIGTSYGGFVAYRIAHMYPHAVHKLVISSSAVNMTPETDEAMVKRFKTKDVTEILQPHDAEGVRRASILAFHQQPLFGIPTFMCNDLLDVSPSLTLVFFRQRKEKKVRRLNCYHFIFKLV